MLHLLCTWSSTRWRIVCADSYFASSSAAMQLYAKHFRFIGVVKTVTRQYPKAYLSAIEMPYRRAVSALIGSTDGPELRAFVYCDRDRHYFISTCSNIAGGDPIQHVRLRQLEPIETKEPRHEFIMHNCPQAAQLYYGACGKIDQHNWCRQSGLATEKKIRVRSWDKRVNISIFSMIVVDSFLLHRECTGGNVKQLDYYRALLSHLLIIVTTMGWFRNGRLKNKGVMHRGKQGWRGLRGGASISHRPNAYTKRSVQKNANTGSRNANSVA
jgi:Transposase IS4